MLKKSALRQCSLPEIIQAAQTGATRHISAPEVRMIMSSISRATNLFFSRQVIPFLKNTKSEKWSENFDYYRHVGMYAYRADVLQKLTALPQSSLERAESLEQLRWLEHGFRIKCIETEFDSHCIDRP